MGSVCLCLVVFGCCEHVLLCDSMCCLRCVVGCRRCVGCCVVVRVQKKNKKSAIPKKNPAREFFPLILIRKIFKPHQITVITYIYIYIYIRKQLICTTHFCNHFRSYGIRQSMGWWKVCGTAGLGIWVLKGDLRGRMLPRQS